MVTGSAIDSGVPIPRANILGLHVSAINMETAVATIYTWIARREAHYVCVTNVHGVMESQHDEQLLNIYNSAGLVTPDGMPLVWLSRFTAPHVERVCGRDLVLAVCKHSVSRGYRHFFYGGAPGVPELLAERLQARFPELRVAGIYSPPFRPLTPEEDSTVVQLINDARSDIVWVGIGAPKQERWMAEHSGRLNAPVLIGVGAAFDFHAGLKKSAPDWIQRSGLEWLFRLIIEPRRLWRRYLVYNPWFVWLVVRQAFEYKPQYDRRLASRGRVDVNGELP